jgi:hypothetical protein
MPTVSDARVGDCTTLTSHGNAEQRSDRQELGVRVAESRAQLEHRNQDQIADQRPFSAEPVRQDSEQQGAERSEEKSESNGRGDLLASKVAPSFHFASYLCVDIELLRQPRYRQGDSEEVVAVACPRKPT